MTQSIDIAVAMMQEAKWPQKRIDKKLANYGIQFIDKGSLRYGIHPEACVRMVSAMIAEAADMNEKECDAFYHKIAPAAEKFFESGPEGKTVTFQGYPR